jgi:hypothetical protein
MHIARFAVLAFPVVALTALAIAQESSQPLGPGKDQLCRECGVVYEIRQLTGERELARTLEEQAPEAGPIITIPLGKKTDGKPRIGVVASESARKSMVESTYEVVIRYDDGRFTRREVSDISNLSIGARVHVHQNRIEPADSQ